MTQGPKVWKAPFAGGKPSNVASAVKVDEWPYGVSAIEANPPEQGYIGLPAWKYPLDQCGGLCNGTAMDGDQDAVLGMTYLPLRSTTRMILWTLSYAASSAL